MTTSTLKVARSLTVRMAQRGLPLRAGCNLNLHPLELLLLQV